MNLMLIFHVVVLLSFQLSSSYGQRLIAPSGASGVHKNSEFDGSREFISNRRTEDHSGHDHGEGEHDENRGPNKPWGKVIISTLLINLVTLSGIIFLVPAFSRSMKHRIAAAICWTADKEVHADQDGDCGECREDVSAQHSKVLDIFIPSFAAGALLSTVVFLVLPEALTLLNNAMVNEEEPQEDDHAGHDRRYLEDHEGHDDHGSELDTGAVWRFGAGILGGFMLPILLGALFPRSIEHKCDSDCGPTEEVENNFLVNCMVEPKASCDACDGEEDGEKKTLTETAPKAQDVESAHCNHGHSHAHGEHETLLNAEDVENAHSHNHGHSHEHGEDCSSCRVELASADDVKDVEVPEWKKRAMESNADPKVAPFGMSWNTEGTISASQAYQNNELVDTVGTHTCHTHKKPAPINYSLCLSILIGDSFHNFCDGIFVGVAFMLCDNTTAITIVGITLYHEVAQELADFFLLTRHGGLTVMKALIVNFLAGLSVVLGGIIVLAVDVSDQTIGVVLSIASGVYVHIAATECMPRVNSVVTSNMDRLVTVLAFIVGAVPIGLTLLKHEHC